MARKKTERQSLPPIQCDYRVKRYEDGKYHWMYDISMLKNPSVLIDVYKALGITMIIFAVIMFVIMSCADGVTAEGMGFVLKITGITAAIMFVLGILGYLLYAAISGWVYSVHFIMDEDGVVHQQAPRSEKVGKRKGALAVLAGMLSRKPTVMGTGMLAASRTAMSSDFNVVRKVKAIRWMDTIMVNEPFGKNRVYVCKEDFDFVYDFIISHCPKAQNH